MHHYRHLQLQKQTASLWQLFWLSFVCIENFRKSIFEPSPSTQPHSLLTHFIKARPQHEFLKVHLLQCLFNGRRSQAFSKDSIMHIRRPSQPHYWSIHQTYICCRLSRTSIAAMPPEPSDDAGAEKLESRSLEGTLRLPKTTLQCFNIQ